MTPCGAKKLERELDRRVGDRTAADSRRPCDKGAELQQLTDNGYHT